jgi:hypothetical protein
MRFIDSMDRLGVAGKFSVVPCPGARGCIDNRLPGVSEDELNQFLVLVRDRISRRWDVSPELITHNKALDLQTMLPLDEREDVWASHQNEATLTPYISRALQMLKNVGLEPNGVTSPWYFGSEVEDDYVRAIVTSLREVCGVRVGWYFLHADMESPVVPPRVMYLNREDSTALVAIVSGVLEMAPGYYDFAWPTQYGKPAIIDTHLTPDGKGGRLAELFANRSPVAFHTHWQSLFSNGTGAGLDALIQLCERINRYWGDQAYWLSAHELAVYAAAREAIKATTTSDGTALAFDAPIECPRFTISLPIPKGRAEPVVGETPLERCREGDLLREGTWRDVGGSALLCFALRDGVELAWR